MALTDADDANEPLGARPGEDRLELDVAEARVAAKLFGVETPAVVVGRYRLLELVGRGGMGVVWGAWDPELERKVAVKLVDELRATARDRLVAEARALAKLSHPNVVPIYDVGVVDDRVYLVMEWVVGENLRAYLAAKTKRSVRAIVELYVQAARGLAAVHAAGLVHRDFKPENAMVGTDGRVRVLDFGLARDNVPGATNDIAGTPRYMAPEQFDGAEVTPAADQYALCFALREALEDRGEVPRWLAAITARGTAENAADRFASIDELVRALGRDPARVWRRRILASGAIAVAAGAFVFGRAVHVEACTTTPENPGFSSATRDRIAAHLDALGGFAASERAALIAIFDADRRSWREQYHAACVAHDHHELTTSMYERRLTCLARAESSLAATAEIVEHADAKTFPDARVAAGALVDPAGCVRVDQSLVPLPAPASVPIVRAVESTIERARMFATAARPEAPDVARSGRETAEATGYPPVLAHALLVEGRAQMLADDTRAPDTLERAMRTAFAAHDDATAVEAFARLAYVAASHQRPVDGTTVIQPVADRLGADGAFARLLLLNNLAVVKLATGNDRKAAAALLETALKQWHPGESENDYELVSIPQNLALSIDKPARSVELLTRAHVEAVRLLGPDHPKVLELEHAQIMFLDFDRARALADSSCQRMATLFPQLTDDRVNCEYDAGWLADQAGDDAAARVHFTAAPVDVTEEPLRAQIEATMAALPTAAAPGELALAIERAALAAEPTMTAPWLRVFVADAYIAAARGFERAHDRVSAKRAWGRALPLLETINRPFTARRLARVRAALTAE